MILDSASWLAILLLTISYWFQIWKIHVHREVRDISLLYYILLAVGFAMLGVTAYYEHTMIFLVKQIATTIPVLIIICQVLYHQNDRWHNVIEKDCSSCNKEQERLWAYCPFCGTVGKNKKK